MNGRSRLCILYFLTFFMTTGSGQEGNRMRKRGSVRRENLNGVNEEKNVANGSWLVSKWCVGVNHVSNYHILSLLHIPGWKPDIVLVLVLVLILLRKFQSLKHFLSGHKWKGCDHIFRETPESKRWILLSKGFKSNYLIWNEKWLSWLWVQEVWKVFIQKWASFSLSGTNISHGDLNNSQ